VNGKQRVSLEYDAPGGPRVGKHVTDNLSHDPGAILMMVPIT
jgi:hypothetical protein